MLYRARQTMTETNLNTCTVLDADGRSTSLATHWKDRAVVLVFLRHFG